MSVVGGDKPLIWFTRPTSACVVTLCHRVLLVFVCVFGVKLLLRASQASILTAVILFYFAATHKMRLSREQLYA